jgi:VWFA-related protein
MKKIIVIGCLLFLSIAFFPQEAFKEVSLVVNIEVPIRVYDEKTFVDSLTMDDFQVYEDGVRQKIEAVYLVKKRDIERKEEKKKHEPETARNFFLFFEISEYNSRMGDAIDFFVDNVLLPQDKLWVITPMKAHKMREKVFEFHTKEDIREEFKSLLKKETAVGSSEYNSVLRDMEEISRALVALINPRQAEGDDPTMFTRERDEFSRVPPPIEELAMIYADCLSRLENLRKVDQLQLLDFAKFLKNMEGQKYVFLFYQREFIPRLDQQMMQAVQVAEQNNMAFMSANTTLQNLWTREITFDVDLIKRAYADASVAIHFLFFSKPAERKFGLSMDEESNDIYGAFREMAHATGGFVDSSSNPEYLFKQAVNAAESYYLLYYSPKKYVVDGKFKQIEVRIRGKKYRVVHRAGYIAD